MKITLRNYENIETSFEIVDWELVKFILLFIISGDENALIIYNDDTTDFFDSNINNRTLDILDHVYMIKPNELSRFNKIKGSPEERFTKFTKKG